MLYFLFVSPFFQQSVDAEIRRAAPFRVVKKSVNFRIIESKDARLAEKLGRAVFVFSVFRLRSRRKVDKKDYTGSIYRALKSMKPEKRRDIRIEILDVNSRTEFSAKDLEVKFGQRMEKERMSVNIVRPKTLLYAVIMDMECFVGMEDIAKLQKTFLDPFRHYARSKAGIGRAELKIREAFDDFGIKSGGVALDLGAAPGGWSVFLAQHGFKVIAVDNGELFYDKIKKLKLKCKVTGPRADVGKELKDCNILHVKSDFAKAMKAIDVDKVDFLANDMNIRHNHSAEAMLKFAKGMRKGALSLMTVKCVRKSVDRYLAETTKILRKEYTVVGVRVLPNNRQEATMLLKKV